MFGGTGVGHVDFGDLGWVVESAQNLREHSASGFDVRAPREIEELDHHQLGSSSTRVIRQGLALIILSASAVGQTRPLP
jgi:hypothetical protein